MYVLYSGGVLRTVAGMELLRRPEGGTSQTPERTHRL